MNLVYRVASQWSVTVLGFVLLLLTLGRAITDTNNLVVDFIEVSLPFIVGVSLIIGGTWLARTHPTDRIIQLAMWILGGALVGVAVTVWVLFIISLEQVPAGEPTVLVLNDVGLFMAAGILLGYYATGFEAREHELELSEQRFRALTENSSFAVITIDESSTIRYANDAVEELFEYSPASLTGKPLTMLMPDRLQAPHRDAMTQYLSAGERSLDWAGDEVVGQRANGEEFPVEVSFGEYAVADEHLFTGVIQDVSDRKAAEHRLYQHTTKVTQLHEIATDITVADSRAAVHQRAADGAVELFGADVARVAVVEGDQLVPTVSSDSDDVDASDPVPLSFGYAGQSYQTGTVLRIDDLADTRSAATSTIRDGGTESEPQLGEDPRALLSIPLEGYGVLQVFASEPGAFTERDEEVAEMLATHVMTAIERLSAEATIRRERDRLEEFASLLSHDLRNPLNVAQGRLELIESDSDHLEAIERALNRIERIIEDMLTLAREGDAVGETETISLDELATQAWENVATDAATLEVETDLHLDADRSRLVQVFENLYRNAIEHGGDGVTVRVGALTDGDGFYIEDTGPGIPTAEREDVFESGYTTHQEGTGFGLAIVRRVVEAHGWTVAVTDGSDGGARFKISGIQSVTTPY